MNSRCRLTFLITEQRRVFRPSPASVSCQRLCLHTAAAAAAGPGPPPPPPPDSLAVCAMMSCCSGGVFGGVFRGVLGVLVVEGAGAG